MNTKRFALLVALFTLCISTGATARQPQAPKTTLSNIHARLGLAYLEKHDLPRAKQRLMASLREAPKDPASWYAMGYYLEVTGQPKKARGYYEQAVKVAPNSGEAHNNYGTYLCRMKDYKAGIAQFLVAIKQRNYVETGEAYENAGLCSLLLPDNKAAKQYFIQAINNDPMRSMALLQLAVLNYQANKIAQAKYYLNRFNRISTPTEESKQLATLLVPNQPTSTQG